MGRRKLQWAIHELKSRQKQFAVAASALAQYTGDYNGLVVYLKDKSYGVKTQAVGMKLLPLIQLLEDWFTLNEQVHFQFIRGPDGQMSGLENALARWTGNPGW